jgi:hypothetical protein
MSKNRLERANIYEELNRRFRLSPSTPAQYHTLESQLLEPPSSSPDALPIRPCHGGPVEMPILADVPTRRRRCFRCKSTEHVVGQCPHRKKNCKCTNCGTTGHHTDNCTIKNRCGSPVDQVVSPFAEAVEREEMGLLERINMLDKVEWTPELCRQCRKINPQHNDLECPKYEQCHRCDGWGAYGFVRRHDCRNPKNEDEISLGDEEEIDMGWYQGCD